MNTSRSITARSTLVLRIFSLLLLVATIAIWIDSYWRGDFVRWGKWSLTPVGWRHVVRLICSGRGGIAVVCFTEDGLAGPEIEQRPFMWERVTKPGYASWRADWDFHGRTGFKWDTKGDEHANEHSHEIIFPYHALTLVLAIAPLTWLVRSSRKRRKLPPGTCRRCGYNLTGNVSRVCPECGMPLIEESARIEGTCVWPPAA